MNSSDLLQVPYDHHLAFQGLQKDTIPYELIEKDCIEFNRFYELAFQTGTRLSESDKKNLEADACKSLKRIFGQLKQHPDPSNKEFFIELEKSSLKLLEDDFIYLTRKAGNHLSLGANTALKAQLVENNHFFGQIDLKIVQEILEISKITLEQFQSKLNAGFFKRHDLSATEGPLVRKIIQFVNQEYTRLGVLDAVSFYQGAKTKVVGCALELSDERTGWWQAEFHQYTTGTKASYFHFDESIALPKSILYLTDTTAQNGATGCVAKTLNTSSITHLQYLVGRILNVVGSEDGTHLHKLYQDQRYHIGLSSEAKRKHFMAMPPEMRFNSHLGFDVIPGSSQEEALLSQEKVMEGPAGTFIVFDGSRLLHRGGLVKSGQRIALQLIFGQEVSLIKRALRKAKKVVKG